MELNKTLTETAIEKNEEYLNLLFKIKRGEEIYQEKIKSRMVLSDQTEKLHDFIVNLELHNYSSYDCKYRLILDLLILKTKHNTSIFNRLTRFKTRLGNKMITSCYNTDYVESLLGCLDVENFHYIDEILNDLIHLNQPE